MISKGYHFVINLGIVSNFYISVDPVYPGSCAIGSIVVGIIGIIGTTSIDSLCFIFTIPVHFIHSIIILLPFLLFLLSYNLQSFKETTTSHLFLGAMP